MPQTTHQARQPTLCRGVCSTHGSLTTTDHNRNLSPTQLDDREARNQLLQLNPNRPTAAWSSVRRSTRPPRIFPRPQPGSPTATCSPPLGPRPACPTSTAPSTEPHTPTAARLLQTTLDHLLTARTHLGKQQWERARTEVLTLHQGPRALLYTAHLLHHDATHIAEDATGLHPTDPT